MSIYDYTFKTRKGEEVSMADYKGKVLTPPPAAVSHRSMKICKTSMTNTKTRGLKFLISPATSSPIRRPAPTKKFTPSARDVSESLSLSLQR